MQRRKSESEKRIIKSVLETRPEVHVNSTPFLIFLSHSVIICHYLVTCSLVSVLFPHGSLSEVTFEIQFLLQVNKTASGQLAT